MRKRSRTPSPSCVSPKRAPILRGGLAAIGSVRRDHPRRHLDRQHFSSSSGLLLFEGAISRSRLDFQAWLRSRAGNRAHNWPKHTSCWFCRMRALTGSVQYPCDELRPPDRHDFLASSFLASSHRRPSPPTFAIARVYVDEALCRRPFSQHHHAYKVR